MLCLMLHDREIAPFVAQKGIAGLKVHGDWVVYLRLHTLLSEVLDEFGAPIYLDNVGVEDLPDMGP